MLLLKKKYSVERSPTLNTVLMVEQTLKDANNLLTIPELKRALPKQIMHQTLMVILIYLEYSGKIILHNNKILWAFKEKSKLKNQEGLRVR